MVDWTLICNNGKFDLINYFKSNKRIVWRQNKNVAIGDMAFFYLSSPYSCIKFSCRVLETNIREKERILPFYLDNYPESENNKEETIYNYMELELVSEYDDELMSREKLLKHGMRSFQKSCKAPESLSAFFSSVMTELEA